MENPMRQPLPLMLCLAWRSPSRQSTPRTPTMATLASWLRLGKAWSCSSRTSTGHTHATGFVVARPGDGKKVILTAGHVYQKGMTLTAHVPGMTKPVPCELIST